MLLGPPGCPGWGVMSHHTWAQGHRGHRGMPCEVQAAPGTPPAPSRHPAHGLLPRPQVPTLNKVVKQTIHGSFPALRSSDEDESGNGYFLKSRELKIQSKITLSIPRLKTFFRNWLIRGHASCVVPEGGGQVSGALGRGHAGAMIIKYVK